MRRSIYFGVVCRSPRQGLTMGIGRGTTLTPGPSFTQEKSPFLHCPQGQGQPKKAPIDTLPVECGR